MITYVYNASGGVATGFTVDVAEYNFAYFGYVGGGAMGLTRCGTIWWFSPARLVPVRFKPGEIAFLRYEAQKGKIRSVWIQRYRIFSDYGMPGVIYFDNLNQAFNDSDLVSNADAVTIAAAFLNSRILATQQALQCM